MISIRNKKNIVGAALPVTRPGLLHFSQKIDYGLLLMVELANRFSGEPLSLRTVSDANRMSFFFLQKVALELRRAGLIHADRGKNGGYTLAKPSSCISLRDVIEALEGPLAIMSCLSHGEKIPSCIRKETCGMRTGLGVINNVIVDALSRTSLNDLLQPTWKPST